MCALVEYIGGNSRYAFKAELPDGKVYVMMQHQVIGLYTALAIATS